MERVELTWQEVYQAANAGVMRGILNLRAGNQHGYRFQGDGWDINIMGCLGELAVAKLTGRYWESVVSNPRALNGDVGERLQVRTTEREGGCLILHPDDEDFHFHVLVLSMLPVFFVVGGIFGYEGKQERWWRTNVRNPAFFVPQSALSPLHRRVTA